MVTTGAKGIRIGIKNQWSESVSCSVMSDSLQHHGL